MSKHTIEIIQGHKVEFDPTNHTYTVDGRSVFSVSQICKMDNPNMYQGIDQDVLTRAANKGSLLHNQIDLRLECRDLS